MPARTRFCRIAAALSEVAAVYCDIRICRRPGARASVRGYAQWFRAMSKDSAVVELRRFEDGLTVEHVG
ncbi:hypothetical protein, partial [Dactylosporangium darangshiense]|uniref:hypothetical protein n=1 Tax=Dactylosporangium darangshiense TaxID=579108 RepID=UPI0031E62827